MNFVRSLLLDHEQLAAYTCISDSGQTRHPAMASRSFVAAGRAGFALQCAVWLLWYATLSCSYVAPHGRRSCDESPQPCLT